MGWLEKLETKDFQIISEDGFWPLHHGRSVPRSLLPYARDIGEGLNSNVVMGPVGWIMRNFTEAEAVVQVRRNRVWEYSEDHPLELLIARPNPYYGDDLLWKATVVSYCLDGNAYWQKARNVFGDVLGYWYLPHFLVDPMFRTPPQRGDPFISHYRYRPVSSGPPIDLPVEDVVHYRWGLDPENPRLGLSTLKPLIREIFTDEEAANFSAAILRNMGVPGGVIAPASPDARPKDAEVERMKEYMAGSFTGNRRGEWLVLGVPTDIKQFGFDPQALMLGNLRDIAEERVCAALGVPAAVVGFGSGLQQTKVGATMKELRKEAWDSCIRPMQNSMAKQGTPQLLPDFVAQARRFRMRFDSSAYAASQEEETEKANRVTLLVEKGLVRVDRGQAMLGLEVDPTRQVYLGPSPAPLEPPEEDDDGEKVPDAVAVRMNGTQNGGPSDG